MGIWYRVGTVAVTSGSKTVTGTGTQWQNLMFGVAPGTTFYGPDGKPYEIDTVNSNTSLTLVTDYSGASASGQAYSIDPTRQGSTASLAAQASEVLKYSQAEFTQIQTWMTGLANADVTLTSPAGQTIVAPSWKKISDTVSGQAAVAKAEADKAAASAALAGGIVVASALPLPDVWAPLSDSLRMITGYGRDVLVGSDVVARMVNFSRNTAAAYVGKDGQWKNAAANEPRFEREGLLIEGQSTNVFNNGSGAYFSWTSEGLTQSAGTAPLPFDVFQKTITSSTANPTHISRVLVDIYGTPNPDASGGGPVTVSVIMFGDADAIIAADPKLRVSGLSIPNTAYSIVKLTPGMVRVVGTGIVTAGSDAYFATLQLSWLDRLPSVVVGCYQIEALPFASSYIPTNGAAVTRAADLLQFVGPGNHPDVLPGVPFTFAMRMSCEETATDTWRDVLVCPNIGYNLLRRSGSIIRYYRDGSEQLFISAPGKKMNVIAVKVTAENSCTLRVGASQATSTEVVSIGGKVTTVDITNVAGHVRDFRIWQHALTDEQIKAIA